MLHPAVKMYLPQTLQQAPGGVTPTQFAGLNFGHLM